MENGKNLTSHLATISRTELWPLRWGSCAVVATNSTAACCLRGFFARAYDKHFMTNIYG